MNASATKGNNQELWEKFLTSLDEKLQLGLLEHMRRVSAYHFEEGVLYINPGSEDDHKYLSKDAVFQQLQILAIDSLKVDKVKLRKPE